MHTNIQSLERVSSVKMLSWISTLMFVIRLIMYILYLSGFDGWENMMYTFWILGSFIGLILAAFAGNFIILVIVFAIPYLVDKFI